MYAKYDLILIILDVFNIIGGTSSVVPLIYCFYFLWSYFYSCGRKPVFKILQKFIIDFFYSLTFLLTASHCSVLDTSVWVIHESCAKRHVPVLPAQATKLTAVCCAVCL